MRNPDGAVQRRGPHKFRARITIRGKTHNRTWATRGEAEEWLQTLRTASGDDSIEHRRTVEKLGLAQLLKEYVTEVAEKRESPESRRREVERCQFILNKQPELLSMLAVPGLSAPFSLAALRTN